MIKPSSPNTHVQSPDQQGFTMRPEKPGDIQWNWRHKPWVGSRGRAWAGYLHAWIIGPERGLRHDPEHTLSKNLAKRARQSKEHR